MKRLLNVPVPGKVLVVNVVVRISVWSFLGIAIGC